MEDICFIYKPLQIGKNGFRYSFFFFNYCELLEKTGMKFSTKEEGEGCNLKIANKPTFPVILYVEGLEMKKRTRGKECYKILKCLV